VPRQRATHVNGQRAFAESAYLTLHLGHFALRARFRVTRTIGIMSCWQSRSLNKSVNWALSTQTCTADRFFRCPYGDTPAPDCGAVLAGAYICDPRARCKAAPCGGVQCACIGEGLRFKPSMPADGQRCKQETRVSMLTQLQKMSVLCDSMRNEDGPRRLHARAIIACPP
jgi:hypothetical protein